MFFKKLIKRVIILIKYKNLKIKGYPSLRSKLEGNNGIGYGSEFDGEMGYASYMGNNCSIIAKIGRYTCIGHSVQTIAANHPLAPYVSIHPMFFSLRRKPTYAKRQSFNEYVYADPEKKIAVVIGNDVWIGNNVIILGGITIGDGAVLAAGAVVTTDVEPYSIVAGVPGRHIKYRFTKEQIELLGKINWWNKSRQWLEDHQELFNDIEQFVGICRD